MTSSRPAPTALTASVVIAGDDVHEDLFTASVELQDLLAGAGFVTRVRVGTALFAQPFDDDLVVLYRAAGAFTAAERRGLADAVAAGTGLLALHSTAVYDDDPELLALFGARYTDHGPQPHESRFRVECAAHPVTAGLDPFELTHEHYRVATAPDARVVAWRQAPYGVEPLVVVSEPGDGRVCFVQFGHDQRAWDEPGVRRTVANAAGWLTAGRRNPFLSDTEKED
ncbi:ThuA domain-containing protein [Leifsonia poae]|uniref:ThuA domain-containing protein n=1 Tax=Leifsonia poae TaxID=110933 RepID=UPI001CBC464F|nr:ThuA domain-containing protein [Leifsonia poae]